MNNIFCIYGSGGFAIETLLYLKDQYNFSKSDLKNQVVFMVDDSFYKKKDILGIKILPRSAFQVDRYKVVVAIGDPTIRENIVNQLPDNTVFTTILHPSVVKSEWVNIGKGSIIAAGSILTCNITIGEHAHINLHTTVGHDCILGNYLTTAPSVNISGCCKIGKKVYLGTGCSIRENISICNDVVIGMGANVVKNITTPGTYVGTPAKLMKNE